MTSKLTLSIDSRVIAKARRISKLRKTSISAMVSHYISSLREDGPELDEDALPPITRRVMELTKNIPPVPADWDYRDELSDAIAERYDVK